MCLRICIAGISAVASTALSSMLLQVSLWGWWVHLLETKARDEWDDFMWCGGTGLIGPSRSISFCGIGHGRAHLIQLEQRGGDKYMIWCSNAQRVSCHSCNKHTVHMCAFFLKT